MWQRLQHSLHVTCFLFIILVGFWCRSLCAEVWGSHCCPAGVGGVERLCCDNCGAVTRGQEKLILKKQTQNKTQADLWRCQVCHEPVLMNPGFRVADESKTSPARPQGLRNCQQDAVPWLFIGILRILLVHDKVKRDKNFFLEVNSYLGSGVILKCCWKQLKKLRSPHSAHQSRERFNPS